MHVSLLLHFVVGSTPKWRRMTGLLLQITTIISAVTSQWSSRHRGIAVVPITVQLASPQGLTQAHADFNAAVTAVISAGQGKIQKTLR